MIIIITEYIDSEIIALYYTRDAQVHSLWYPMITSEEQILLSLLKAVLFHHHNW